MLENWLPVLVVMLATFLLILFVYPKVEDQLLLIWNEYETYFTNTCHQMFWEISPNQVKWILLGPTLLLAAIGFFMSRGFSWITIVFTCLFAYLGWLLPKIVLSILWNRRMLRFDEQLVDALNLMANSLKSGLNFSQSLGILVRELPNPLAQEFSLVLSQKQLGLSLDEALEKMIERVPSKDLSIALNSVLILRETGGDLSETFDTIAHTIRERRKVDGKITALTAQGKMQGLILFCMPFGFGFFLYISNPDYLAPMFSTKLGWLIILCATVLQAIGLFWIRKIIRIEV